MQRPCARLRPGRLRPDLFRRMAALLSAALLVTAAQAQTEVVPQATDLASNAELMISYRHQERMWQTPDGALHLIINRGTLRPNPGLALFTSYDGGSTWLLKASFARTNRDSTVDGQLDGATLSVVYEDLNGAVVFAQLSYDGATRAWTVNRTESVYRASGMDAGNPTLAFDDAGIAWCAFAVINAVTNDINLRWFYRPSEGVWLDTGLVLGPTDNLSKQRSGRPVAIPGGMGLLYRVNQKTYWTTRPNGAAANVLADPQLIHEGSARAARNDPWASHFNVVADDGGHLHLAIANDGAAMYLRYSKLAGTWSAARQINEQGTLSYLQIGIANGQLQLSLSSSRGAGMVYLSNDYGDTFRQAFALRLPAPSDGVSYKTGRVETAGRSSGVLAVLQQYEDQNAQRLMVYKVPVP